MLTPRLVETLDMVNRMQFPSSEELAERLTMAITTARNRLLGLYALGMIDRRMELDAPSGFRYRYFVTQKGELMLNEYRRHAREVDRIHGL